MTRKKAKASPRKPKLTIVKPKGRKAAAKTRAATEAAIDVAARSVVETPPTEAAIDGTQDQRADAAQRAELCSRALDEVLQRFRCRIVPVLNQTLEMIGGSPTEPSNKGVVTCTYGVAPLV